MLTEEQKDNRENMGDWWFSDPQKTREAAEALHQPDEVLFNPAAVYRREPEGDYVMGRLRPTIKSWPPHKEATKIDEVLGYVMVSCCDPMFGIWEAYQPEPAAAE